jgi:uncharacterized membrane protein (UPF0127 family)
MEYKAYRKRDVRRQRKSQIMSEQDKCAMLEMRTNRMRKKEREAGNRIRWRAAVNTIMNIL